MPRKTRASTYPQLVEAARTLRHEQTHAEQLLWQALRGRQLEKIKFRRQHAIGPYILDFFCAAQALAIEVDGAVHDNADQQQLDQERTAFLNQMGIAVLRFTNDQVESDLDRVIQQITETINKK